MTRSERKQKINVNFLFFLQPHVAHIQPKELKQNNSGTEALTLKEHTTKYGNYQNVRNPLQLPLKTCLKIF